MRGSLKAALGKIRPKPGLVYDCDERFEQEMKANSDALIQNREQDE